MPKAIKQIVVIAAVVAISMVFIIQFRPGTDVQLSGGPTCAIEISGECIQHSDFVTAFRLMAPNVDADTQKQMRLRQVVLEGLVERWLLVEDAKRLGISASNEDTTTEIGGKAMARFSLPASRDEQYNIILSRYLGAQLVPTPIGPARRIPVVDPKTNSFDYKRYQRWVSRSSSKTEKDFKEFQRLELIAARMRSLIRSRVRISAAEAYKRFARENEKLVVDYVKLERAYYKDHVIDQRDEAVAAWRDANLAEVDEAWESRKDLYLPECRKARHLLIRIDETDPDKEAAKTKARATIDAAKARIDGGESFADVAKAVSQDTNSASKGGDLGCFAAGKLARPTTTIAIDDKAFALNVGVLSEVIESSHGMHLVIVDKIANEEQATKIGKADVSRELYLRKESERVAAEGAAQILAAAKDGKTLADAIDAHLMAILPEGAREAYEAGKAHGDDAPGDGPPDAWTDPSRPRVAKSDPFTSAGPPFSQVQSAADATGMLFKLDKVGALPDDVIKLYDGYAVAQLTER